MFYMVPKGRTVDYFVHTTESFIEARFYVNFMKKSRDEEYDIIEMRRYPFDNVNEPTALHDGPPEVAVDESLYM